MPSPVMSGSNKVTLPARVTDVRRQAQAGDGDAGGAGGGEVPTGRTRMQIPSEGLKPRFCDFMLHYGNCIHGDTCRFLHSREEVRHVPADRARGVNFEDMYKKACTNRTEWLAKEEGVRERQLREAREERERQLRERRAEEEAREEVAERRAKHVTDGGSWLCGFCEEWNWSWREECYFCSQDTRAGALKVMFPDPVRPVKQPPPIQKMPTTFYPVTTVKPVPVKRRPDSLLSPPAKNSLLH